jgi:hypothetical protein
MLDDVLSDSFYAHNVDVRLVLISAVALSERAADETTVRLDRAAAVFAKLTTVTASI